MAMVNVVTIAAYRRICWLRLIGLVCTRQLNRVNSRSGSALVR